MASQKSEHRVSLALRPLHPPRSLDTPLLKAVKPEPLEDDLVSALSAQRPPIHAPLRATNAPPDMRKMMGVFRVNPFTSSRPGSSSNLYDGEARPLEQEPTMSEFQLDLPCGAVTLPLEDEELERFSPEQEQMLAREPPDYHTWHPNNLTEPVLYGNYKHCHSLAGFNVWPSHRGAPRHMYGHKPRFIS